MIVRDENQALSVAVEMEKRAIRMYERALMLATDDEVRGGISSILADERRHLCRFTAMQGDKETSAAEDAILTDAMASQVLFTGGMAEMNRAHAMTTLRGLYEYAAESEQDAVEKYTSFAEASDREDVKAAFLAIAEEEKIHLQDLRQSLKAMP